MKIKNLVDKTTSFLFKRLSELIGLALLCLSVLLLTSLISYSPEDPNFIFPDDAEIKNLLGAKGSYASDILYQSVGLISLLVPISLFFIGLSFLIGFVSTENVLGSSLDFPAIACFDSAHDFDQKKLQK